MPKRTSSSPRRGHSTYAILLTRTSPTTSVKYEFFLPSDPRRALVIVTTPSRIYQLVGTPDPRNDDSGRIFSIMFALYRDEVPKMLELPGDTQHSELHFYTANPEQANSLPRSLAWMTGKQEFRSAVPQKPNEEVRGITADPVRKTYWVYTDQSIFELLVANEDRDVRKIYLEKGQYEIALRCAKTASRRNKVLAAQADHFFTEGRFFQAAQCYAQCSVSFEEVTTDITQRMMLATWLVEFYLSKCNELEDMVASESVLHDVGNLQAERAILEDD
ncbi:Pep3/Vps18/deep orange family-domain-containing protein [Lentinula raphanica]|nr:Pep3/Vps18/deep orange family-domain-containing protein [Lentinula raphanica]